MSAPKKTAVAVLALMGAVFASAALADKGPGGMGGMGGPDGRGAMLLEKFDAMDADKDGKLSLAEIEASRLAEFTAADTNGDGQLSADELSARQLARFQETQGQRTQMMLDHLDNDSNGSLSEDELGEGPGERHFARIDADNDGAISKEEAEEMLQKGKRRGHGWGKDDN